MSPASIEVGNLSFLTDREVSVDIVFLFSLSFSAFNARVHVRLNLRPKKHTKRSHPCTTNHSNEMANPSGAGRPRTRGNGEGSSHQATDPDRDAIHESTEHDEVDQVSTGEEEQDGDNVGELRGSNNNKKKKRPATRRLTELVEQMSGLNSAAEAARIADDIQAQLSGFRQEYHEQQQQQELDQDYHGVDQGYHGEEGRRDWRAMTVQPMDDSLGKYAGLPELAESKIKRYEERVERLKVKLKDGKDWRSWDVQLRVNARVLGLMQLSDIEKYGPNTNLSLRFAIDRTISDSLVESTLEFQTPLALYWHLKTLFGPEERSNKVDITKAYHKLQWRDGVKIEDFLVTMEDVWRKYSLHVHKLGVEERMFQLLAIIEDRRVGVYSQLTTYIARDWQGLDGEVIISEMKTLIINRCRERKKEPDDKKTGPQGDNKGKQDHQGTKKGDGNGKVNPYSGKKCHRCGKMGHIEKDCYSNPDNKKKPSTNHVKAGDQQDVPGNTPSEAQNEAYDRKSTFQIGTPVWYKDVATSSHNAHATFKTSGMEDIYGSHLIRYVQANNSFHVRQTDKWLFDTGSDCHIVCDKSWFTVNSFIDTKGHLTVGGGEVLILGQGNVDLSLKRTDGSFRQITLVGVLYCPAFQINIFSGLIYAKKGGDFDSRKMVDCDGDEVACFDVSSRGFYLDARKGEGNEVVGSTYLATDATRESPKATRRR